MDISGPDAAKSDKQRKHQRGGDEEYRAKRKEIGDEAHKAGRHYASHRGEALIASQSFGQRCIADEAEADGYNRQPQEATGDPLKHQGSQHQWEIRPDCDNERAGCDHTGT